MTKESKRAIPFNVDWIVGRMHVGTGYEDVAVDIKERIVSNNPTFDRQQMARTITDAIIAHKRNRELYSRVMG